MGDGDAAPARVEGPGVVGALQAPRGGDATLGEGGTAVGALVGERDDLLLFFFCFFGSVFVLLVFRLLALIAALQGERDRLVEEGDADGARGVPEILEVAGREPLRAPLVSLLLLLLLWG